MSPNATSISRDRPVCVEILCSSGYHLFPRLLICSKIHPGLCINVELLEIILQAVSPEVKINDEASSIVHCIKDYCRVVGDDCKKSRTIQTWLTECIKNDGLSNDMRGNQR